MDRTECNNCGHLVEDRPTGPVHVDDATSAEWTECQPELTGGRTGLVAEPVAC